MNPSKGESILELGCGTGYLYLEFLKRGYEDNRRRFINADMIERFKRTYSRRITRKKIKDWLLAMLETFFDTRMIKNILRLFVSALLHHLYDFESVIKIYMRSPNPGRSIS